MRQRPGNKPRTIEGERSVMIAFGRKVRRPGGALELAAATGVSTAFICRVRKGEKRITPRLAEGLGFRLRYERVRRSGTSAVDRAASERARP